LKRYRVLAGFAVGIGRGVGTPEGRGYLAIQGTLGLGKAIRGGDAGVDDEDESPTAIVKAADPPGVAPPRSTYDGQWRMILLSRQLRIPHRVLFEEGAAILPEAGNSTLTELARWLRTHPEAGRVTVRGHSGLEGDSDSEALLSKSRAEVVVAFLVSQGVDGKRLLAEEFGRQLIPRLPEGATEEQEAIASRRVDFHFGASGTVAAK
jgi:outer membrane protein OmpA-like peptidoglycan-associated protein